MSTMSDSLRASQADWCLECVGLSVFRGGRCVLADVTVALRPGECVSVVGPNGSGKTTLMLALLGLLPPSAGTVRWDGRDPVRLSARQRTQSLSIPRSSELMRTSKSLFALRVLLLRIH